MWTQAEENIAKSSGTSMALVSAVMSGGMNMAGDAEPEVVDSFERGRKLDDEGWYITWNL